MITRRVSIPVPDEAALARLAASARPLGMAAGKLAYVLARETVFDSPDGTLRSNRLTLRLRVDGTGRRVVRLTELQAVNLDGVVEEEILEVPVTGLGLYSTLTGSSELATRVRSLVDPVALRPQVAMDIDREIRELKPGWLGRPVHRVRFDRIVAHVPGASRTFQEISVEELRQSGTSLESVADRVRGELGVQGDGLDRYERVRQALLAGLDEAAAADLPNEVRLSVFLLRGGEVALTRGGSGLVLPTTRGSGEEVAREFTHEAVGEAEDLDLLGFAPVRGGGMDLEVWLHEGVARGKEVPGHLLWIPLTELMERVGGPGLRDPALLAALLLLVRSDTGLRLLKQTQPGRTRPLELPLRPRPNVRPGKHPEDFLDAELSILDFNARVLDLAEDEAVPLLERFRFLSIFSGNQDEFFVVRVGRLKTEADRGMQADDAELEAAELLDTVAIRARALVARQHRMLTQRLLPELADRGIRMRRWDGLSARERSSLAERFSEEIFPLLTPHSLTASPGQPFPRLPSLGLSLAAVLQSREGGRPRLAHVPLPRDLRRFLEIPGSSDLIPVEDVVVANASLLFPAFQVTEAHAFRVSRLGDVRIDERGVHSLLSAVEDEVEARAYKPVVRIEVERTMPREVRAHLLRELRTERGTETVALSRNDIYEVDGPIDRTGFAEIADLDLPEDRYPPFEPARPLTEERGLFEILAERDVLVFHPYEAFDNTVGRFLAEAARDPDVVSIRLTLYRTGKDSPVMEALLAALQAGKDVSVFVELKARFDEESNIAWTHRLTEAGGHVVYGVVGYKTHAKTALVVRKEPDGVRRYVHVGTGNYNATTSRIYTDLGLMTSDPDIGADVNDFFNELTGSAGPPAKEYRQLLVAPHTLARELLRAVEREIEHARAGRKARIRAKMNGLSDKKVVKALYRAAQEGVEVDLLVRAICTLRPGVPGLSEGIRVRSLLGRFLEHARIYEFANAGETEFFIGSADWRKRNLRRRVEVVAPVHDGEARARLERILDAEWEDPRAWVLRTDGAYERLSGEGPGAQERFLREAGGVHA